MPTMTESHIYDGEGDNLMSRDDAGDRIILLPDHSMPPTQPDATPRVRIMWGHRLLDDVLAGRYKSLICAVNAEDNSHGIISQLADLLPTSQWTNEAITSHARHFVQPKTVTVVKYDMDTIEVLALLRPSEHAHLTLDDLSLGFKMVTAMIHRRPERRPSASVSFLGARAEQLVADDDSEDEPTFEAVLRTMYDAGYRGDVYPATWMWESAPTSVFAHYPFPDSLERMRDGGF